MMVTVSQVHYGIDIIVGSTILNGAHDIALFTAGSVRQQVDQCLNKTEPLFSCAIMDVCMRGNLLIVNYSEMQKSLMKVGIYTKVMLLISKWKDKADILL